jgi:hypothetical protein
MSDENERSVASAGSVGEVLAKGIADIIRIAAEPDWIPVTERLPDYGEMVLCYGWNRGVEQACRSKYWDGWVGPDKKNLVTHAYTHWMPLPAPPTDGK